MTKNWMQTTSGVPFELMDPRASDVRIEDIAHHLARINRFSGATKGVADSGYSVAQHSCLVADILALWGAPLEIVREGLLHDAGEAYYGDITSPVKQALDDLRASALDTLRGHHAFTDEQWSAVVCAFDFARLKTLTGATDNVVRIALALPATETPIVKRADLVALAIERRDLLAACDRSWNMTEFADTRIEIKMMMAPPQARRVFLERLRDLDEQISKTLETVAA
jgi:5'-deoxynucleotidase YfbR-like HD superfamily hydrolase